MTSIAILHSESKTTDHVEVDKTLTVREATAHITANFLKSGHFHL